MELRLRKSDLLRELQLFQGIVERKNTIPVLANVLIKASKGTVEITATDLEVGLRSQCKGSILKDGSLTLPAKKLYEIVRALPETEIQIEESAKGSVKIAADHFSSRIQTLPREDFPTLPEPSGEEKISLPRAVFREMIKKTQFAITGEDTRYFLNGALFIFTEDEMSLIATDGHRLALTTASRGGNKEKGEQKENKEIRVILPKKTLLELARLLVDGDDDVRYERGENHLFFDIGGRVLISRVIDAQFPAYERVIPKGNDKKIEFERDRLTSAIKRVALLSNERSRAIRFKVDSGKVEVTSSSPELGEASEVLLVDHTSGPLQLCFNAQYVLDFLTVIDTETVTLEFKDEMSQAVMKPVGADGYEYTYVIMPMRV